jgi:hypothetical protein
MKKIADQKLQFALCLDKADFFPPSNRSGEADTQAWVMQMKSLLESDDIPPWPFCNLFSVAADSNLWEQVIILNLKVRSFSGKPFLDLSVLQSEPNLNDLSGQGVMI